jgi:hypothetical protein
MNVVTFFGWNLYGLYISILYKRARFKIDWRWKLLNFYVKISVAYTSILYKQIGMYLKRYVYHSILPLYSGGTIPVWAETVAKPEFLS